MSQRVKHGNVWNVPGPGKLHSSHARKPVMAVQHIVAYCFLASKFFNMLREIRQILVKIVLGNGRCRASFHMDYPYVGGKLNDMWLMCFCLASKDIDCYLGIAQFACKFVYVYIHAPGIFATSRCIKRRRMDAEHGYGITHAEYAPLLELKLVIITDAWPASFALQLLKRSILGMSYSKIGRAHV